MRRPTPVLKRFDLTVLKQGPGARLVPALSAIADFYLQGATLAPPNIVFISSGEQADVTVYHPGAIQPGDTVQINSISTVQLEVISVTLALVEGYATGPSAIIRLELSAPGIEVELIPGDRLVVSSRRPFVYQDPAGELATADHFATDPNGRIRCYLRPFRYDYIVSYDGSPQKLYSDATGSYRTR